MRIILYNNKLYHIRTRVLYTVTYCKTKMIQTYTSIHIQQQREKRDQLQRLEQNIEFFPVFFFFFFFVSKVVMYCLHVYCMIILPSLSE